MYSLGVVLLEVGLWRPLDIADEQHLNFADTSGWPEELLRIAEGLVKIVGLRYCRLVKWCLSLKGDTIVEGVDFA